MDVFNAFKGVADMIRDAVEGAMPRQAVVTRSEGTGVWVRYTPVDPNTAEMWFPSSIAGLPAGTSGWVHPLAGGKGRFIATGIAIPIPFAATSGSTTSTTSLTTYTYAGTDSVSVPPGTYSVTAAAFVPSRRSVGSGRIDVAINVGGAEASLATAISAIGVGANEWYTMAVHMQSQQFTTETGVVDLRFGVRGTDTAGTTSIYRGVMTGTLTRIG